MMVISSKLDGFIESIQERISELDFGGKRQVLDMLGITVWLDGENVDTGRSLHRSQKR